MKNTTIQQLEKISNYIYQVPYDALTDYLKGIRDMINLLNGEEQDNIELSETVLEKINEVYIDVELPF